MTTLVTPFVDDNVSGCIRANTCNNIRASFHDSISDNTTDNTSENMSDNISDNLHGNINGSTSGSIKDMSVLPVSRLIG